MTASSILFAALRGALVLGVALAAMPFLRSASAATRRMVLVFAFAVVVIMPIATAVLPSLHLASAAESADVPAVVVASSPETIVEATGTALASPVTAVTHAAPIASAPGDAWSPSPLAIVLALWALGALAVLARLGAGLYRARRLVKNSRLVEVRRAVEIRSSAAIDTPAVTGLFTPVVLLPCDADSWTDERRELVLAHELAHVARRDCLASVIAQIAVAMHWFDPLVWIAARKLRIERELAADDRVLDAGATASTYAEHLLDLATTHGDRSVPAGALAMAEPAQVSVRIRALLAPGHSRKPVGRARFAILGACGLAIATVIACSTPEPEPTAIPDATAHRVPSITMNLNATGANATGAKTSAATTDGARSTIDPAVQSIVDEEADRLAADWAPCAAVVLVVDPRSGNVLAASHRGGTEATAELAAARPMVPGSTIKPLIIAAALEEGVITPAERFDASPLPFSIKTPTITDASPNGMLDASGILEVSSNVGMSKVFAKLGGAKLAMWLERFAFMSAPATIEDDTRGAAISIGATLQSTPLEIAGAFAMLANGGTYHTPRFFPMKDHGARVLDEKTTRTVIGMLEAVVTSDRGTGRAARIEGVRVGGKTGTAHVGQDKDSKDYYASFVGMAPLENPRYVIFVGAETPRDGGSGGKVAAPVFARIMKRLLVR